jgi:hypothetical protein
MWYAKQLDRGRELEVLDVGLELDARAGRDVRDEAVEGFAQALAAEGRSVQVADEGSDHLGGAVLALPDVVEGPARRR